MLRYSLLMLVRAHCAVYGLANDGDATKNARLVSVVNPGETLPKLVVGLPDSKDTKAANTNQDTKVEKSSPSTPTIANQDSASTESSNGDKIANITEMGDAKIKNSDMDAKLTTNEVDYQVTEATKSAIEKPSGKADIKDPTLVVHLDNKDSSTSNKDGEHPAENSGGKPSEEHPVQNSGEKPSGEHPAQNSGEKPSGEHPAQNSGDKPSGEHPAENSGEKPSGGSNENGGEPPTASSTSKNEINPAENGSENNPPSGNGEAESATSSTEPSTVQAEGEPSSSSTSSTTEASTTEESVSPPSTASSASETAVTAASAAEVEATPEDEGMSSGVVALVMAIVFAIIVVIVYVGLLLWRRYLEYRYGTRELLVNDLEFDTNDLRHFEL